MNERIATIPCQNTLTMEGQKKVLVIGSSGSGKSSLINCVLGRDIAHTSNGISCTTKTLDKYIDEVGAFTISFIDTPGMSGSLINVARYSKNAYDLVLHVVRAGRISSSHEIYNDYARKICENIPRVVVLNDEEKCEKWLKRNYEDLSTILDVATIVGPYDLSDIEDGHELRKCITKLLEEQRGEPKALRGDLLVLGDTVCLKHVATGHYISKKRKVFGVSSRPHLSKRPYYFTAKDDGFLCSGVVSPKRDIALWNNNGDSLCTTKKNRLSYKNFRHYGEWTVCPQEGVDDVQFDDVVHVKSEGCGYLSAQDNGRVVMKKEPDEWIFVLQWRVPMVCHIRYDGRC